MSKTDLTPERVAELRAAAIRISHLISLEIDSFGDLVGPACEDGVGRYSPDLEGQDGEDIADLLAAAPALLDTVEELARVREALKEAIGLPYLAAEMADCLPDEFAELDAEYRRIQAKAEAALAQPQETRG